MKVSTAVALVTNLIKEHSNESHYTPALAWELYNVTKAKLLKQRLDKFKAISPLNRRTFCIGLSEKLSHDCGCITVGCKVLASCVEIPTFLSSRNKSTLRVQLLDGTLLNELDEADADIVATNELKVNKPSYSIVNGNLILWNTKKVAAVLLTAVWGNLTDWENIQYCDNNCEEDQEPNLQASNSCVDVYEMEVDVDEDMHYDILNMVLNLLRIPLSVLPDRTNDSQEEIKV